VFILIDLQERNREIERDSKEIKHFFNFSLDEERNKEREKFF
jgi:hypothetical protein